MIIFEGGDQLGKTTACKRLVEMVGDQIPAWYAHMTRPVPAFNFDRDYVERMNGHAVQDRFHLGSIVWHNGVMNQAKLRGIEHHLDRWRSVIVVVYTKAVRPYEIMLKQNSGREMFDPVDIVRANAIYRSIVERKHQWNPHWDIAIEIEYHDGEWYFINDAILQNIADFWLERINGIESPETTSTMHLRTRLHREAS